MLDSTSITLCDTRIIRRRRVQYIGRVMLGPSHQGDGFGDGKYLGSTKEDTRLKPLYLPVTI